MDWLTARDWNDLGEAAIGMAGVALLVLLARALIRWRDPGTGRKLPEYSDFIFVFAMVAIFALSDIFARRSLSDWWLWMLLLPVIFFPAWLDRRRQARRRAETGAGEVAPCQLDSVPLSGEEKRLTTRIILISLGAAALSIGALLLLAFGPVPGGTTKLLLLLALCAAMLGLIAYLAKGRWPGSLTLNSAIDIEAPAQAIWALLRYADGEPSYKRIIRRVELLAHSPHETFLLHYYNDEHCHDCGLPRDPEVPGRFARVEVVEAREGEFYRFHSCEADARGKPQPGMLDMEDESHTITPLQGGGCRVVNRSTVSRPLVWLALILKIGDPLGEHLRHLKAKAEGREGETLWDTGAARIEVRRSAEQHCLCPETAFRDNLGS